jgi:hypothetical protein
MEIHQRYYGTPMQVDQTKPKRPTTTEKRTLKKYQETEHRV